MQLKKVPLKKLKILNSLDTEATLSECNEQQAKKSLKSPKESKQNISILTPVQILEEAEQEELVRLTNEKSKYLIKVPHMRGRRKQSQLFDTQNFQIMLRSQNQEAMKNLIRNTSKTNELSSRYMNENSTLMLLNQQQKQSNYRDSQQKQVAQFTNNMKSLRQPEESRKQNESVQNIIKQKNSKKLKRAKSDFQIMQGKRDKIKEEECYTPIITKKTANQFYERLNQPSKESFLYQNNHEGLTRPLKNEQPQQIERQIEKAQNQSSVKRLKLRELMVKAQIQSAKALQQKRKEAQVKKERLKNVVPRKEPSKKPNSKYVLTNKQLCQLLKEQIYQELNQGVNCINLIKANLSAGQFTSDDPTNQELVSIFSLRQLIKEQITKKLQNLSKKVARNQEGKSKAFKSGKITQR